MSLNPFQQVSEDNLARLEQYLGRLQAAGQKLPSRGAKVNKTAVATACGFNRETFNQNKRFSERLNLAVKDIGLEQEDVPEASTRDTADKSRINQLEQQLASVRSENYELRRRLARYEHMTATGRRVIP